MKWAFRTLLRTALLLPTAALAQDSLCDKYTRAIFSDNSGSSQYSLIIRLINTALIGNYIAPSNVNLSGILLPGVYNGQEISLLSYFNGGLVSTNRGTEASVVNFLDDGGVTALSQNKPSYSQTSNQYKFVSHLYQYFGALLGCSSYGRDGFATYQGSTRMYEVHKYMNLGPTQFGYFIQEISLAAAAIGFEEDDVQGFASKLNTTFGQRCAPKQAVLPNSEPDLQSLCIDITCPLALGGICPAYNHFGGFGIDPASPIATAGPQVTDITPKLNSAIRGQGEITPRYTTSAVSLTTTISGKPTVLSTYTVVRAMPDPVSFTTMRVTVSTRIEGVDIALTTKAIVPIGGGTVTATPTTMTNSGSVVVSEVSYTIPSSVVQKAITTINTEGTIITSTYDVTLRNPVFGPESSKTALAPQNTTASVTSTRAPNGASLQTAGPILVAAIGAGIIGQML
ncbi:hypothetical protein Dda_5287 [Drechslerella dactyloides]|uniref:Uncharacterized protein n=1 Tax=Drechslerella dactyloides TaxID=74499 RepID=A0AAD6IVX2_DREDA|nr:hypothetical protein Dda_5287 [Drechslerella dactyloides]